MTATTFGRFRPDERMIAVEEAQQRVLDEISVLESESVALIEAHGRVLREDVRATRDVPQADNSAMDGYAVLAADLAGASEQQAVALKVIEDLPAGRVATSTVESGTAIRIMTGAPIPRGADAVAQVEITDGGADVVHVSRKLEAGANIRRRGEDMRAGAVVVQSGCVLRAGEIGVLAAAQQAVVRVGRRPVVAILSTGSEVVEIDAPVTPGKVVNSNAHSLAALVSEAGAIPRRHGIVADTKEATIHAIESALDADFVISSGGVSVGAYDFVKDALDELGAKTRFWQVAMRPGKPVVLSTLRNRLYFGLPGNPVSCMVAFHIFIAPAIRKATGVAGSVLPPAVRACLTAPLQTKGERRVYMRVVVRAEGGELVADPMPSQGSGVSTSMVGANGLAVLEAGATAFGAGELAPVILIGPIAAT